MSPAYNDPNARKGESSKAGARLGDETSGHDSDEGAEDLAPMPAETDPAEEDKDKSKTAPGQGASGVTTEGPEDFPEFTPTYPIPVHISDESGEKFTPTQLRRQRRYRERVRRREGQREMEEQEALREQYQQMNAAEGDEDEDEDEENSGNGNGNGQNKGKGVDKSNHHKRGSK
ncbi:hypothetical protein ACHAP5_010767 [Fusarium lateritium]